MLITINDQIRDIPFFLSNITFGQYGNYYEKYGRGLQQQLKDIEARDYTDMVQKQIDLDIHTDNEALAWYSFFSGFDLFEVRDEPFIIPVLAQYRLFAPMLRGENELVKDFNTEFEFGGDMWQIQHFTRNPAESITFNELNLTREVLRNVETFNATGSIKALLFLCAVFVRKKDEPFTQRLLQEERLNTLKQLPFNHAICVGLLINQAIKSTGLSIADLDPLLTVSLIQQQLLN